MFFLVTTLLVWMTVCVVCGFQKRFVAFLAMVAGGLALNMFWMTSSLGAEPFETNALLAQASALGYAVCAFCVGWFAGRIRQAWVDSRVEDTAL